MNTKSLILIFAILLGVFTAYEKDDPSLGDNNNPDDCIATLNISARIVNGNFNAGKTANSTVCSN